MRRRRRRPSDGSSERRRFNHTVCHHVYGIGCPRRTRPAIAVDIRFTRAGRAIRYSADGHVTLVGQYGKQIYVGQAGHADASLRVSLCTVRQVGEHGALFRRIEMSCAKAVRVAVRGEIKAQECDKMDLAAVVCHWRSTVAMSHGLRCDARSSFCSFSAPTNKTSQDQAGPASLLLVSQSALEVAS